MNSKKLNAFLLLNLLYKYPESLNEPTNEYVLRKVIIEDDCNKFLRIISQEHFKDSTVLANKITTINSHWCASIYEPEKMDQFEIP